MKSISIRELRQQASVWLRQVQTGESFQITDRGRPVAVLAPLPAVGGELDRLIASGDVEPASGNILDLGPPLPAKPGLPLPSQVLEQMRAEER
jgi:prevent-host-death family protein